MSYQVYDEDGFVGDFATNKGAVDYLSFIRGQEIPELMQLVSEGFDLIPEAIKEELEKVSPPEGLLMDTHKNFLSLLDKCKGIVIISDGINDDLEDEENTDAKTGGRI